MNSPTCEPRAGAGCLGDILVNWRDLGTNFKRLSPTGLSRCQIYSGRYNWVGTAHFSKFLQPRGPLI
jgi:hypothetical protein